MAAAPAGLPASAWKPATPAAKASDSAPLAGTVVSKPSAPIAPAALPQESVVVKKVETTIPPPSDWRQSWGKVGAPSAAPASPASPKVAMPHAEPRTADPLKTPDKFTTIPQTGGFDAEKAAADKKTPLLAALALHQPPAPAPAEVKAPSPVVVAKAIAPAVPSAPPAAPVAVAKTPPPVSMPTLAPAPPAAPAVVDLKPAAPTKADAAPPAPAVPLGLGSVLAAASPELAAPMAPAPKPAAPTQVGVGVRADEPNAFTDHPRPGTTPSAPNAFSAPDAPPPDALAMNAFPTPQQGGPVFHTRGRGDAHRPAPGGRAADADGLRRACRVPH